MVVIIILKTGETAFLETIQIRVLVSLPLSTP
jgi:hypothetical protein